MKKFFEKLQEVIDEANRLVKEFQFKMITKRTDKILKSYERKHLNSSK